MTPTNRAPTSTRRWRFPLPAKRARAGSWGRWVYPCLLACLVVGCGGAKTDSDFIPPDSLVEKALLTALTAWQEGKTPGTIKGTSPPIQVVDAQWQSGQKLKSFEILGEEEVD